MVYAGDEPILCPTGVFFSNIETYDRGVRMARSVGIPMVYLGERRWAWEHDSFADVKGHQWRSTSVIFPIWVVALLPALGCIYRSVVYVRRRRQRKICPGEAAHGSTDQQ